MTTEASTKPFRQCMALLTGSRVPCAMHMGNCLLKTRPPLSHWSEYFQYFFNADGIVQNPAVLRISQQPFKVELDELPSLKKITKAMEQLKSGRAARVDRIPPELGKGGPSITQKALRTPYLLLGAGQTSKFAQSAGAVEYTDCFSALG